VGKKIWTASTASGTTTTKTTTTTAAAAAAATASATTPTTAAAAAAALVVDTIIDGLSKNKYKQMRKTALRTISTKRGAEGIHIMAPLRQKAKDLLIGKSDKRIKALKATIKTMKNTRV